MKFGVITFPGSNCDQDLIFSLTHNLGQQVVQLWHKSHSLEGCDAIFLPGGFSYGDYLRSGAIARFSPVMKEVMAHAHQGGIVIGICNGFQILCESGLLPGSLLHNASMNFICKNVYIKPVNTTSLLTRHLEPRAYKIPIAHAEGNFYCGEDQLRMLEDNNQILFRYCDDTGQVTPESNPNGSLNNIAGICNEKGNVMGLMPHPERATDELLKNIDGKYLLASILS